MKTVLVPGVNWPGVTYKRQLNKIEVKVLGIIREHPNLTVGELHNYHTKTDLLYFSRVVGLLHRDGYIEATNIVGKRKSKLTRYKVK